MRSGALVGSRTTVEGVQRRVLDSDLGADGLLEPLDEDVGLANDGGRQKIILNNKAVAS